MESRGGGESNVNADQNWPNSNIELDPSSPGVQTKSELQLSKQTFKHIHSALD